VAPGTKLVLWTAEATGTMLLAAEISGKEVDRVLGVTREAAKFKEAEQFVSVKVILSVTVKTETTWGFFREIVAALERNVWTVWLTVLEPVEMGKATTETPATGAVKAFRPDVAF